MQDPGHWLPVIAALAAAGAAGGLLAGLLGVGGGIVIVPALDFALQAAGLPIDVALHVAVATSMATIVPTALSSARSHARRGSVDREIVRHWTVPTVIGAACGALVAAYLDGRILAGVFGTVALGAALKMLLPLDHVVLHRGMPRGAIGAAIPAGIAAISAMMGIGGGTLTVPTMTLCGEPVHKAVGTAALLGFWIALPATIAFMLARPVAGPGLPPLMVGWVSLLGLALIAPVSWLVAPLGARLAHALDRRRLALAFGVFLLLVGLRMWYRALG
jgi:uncharacterized membrane protein YfcA